MSTMALSGKTTLILVILAMLCPGIPAQAADADDTLLNMVPEDCMFCLRINNFNESLGKMDQYLAGASPIPMSMAMLINMQLGAIIGDPMVTGIDQGGDFAVFAIFPKTSQEMPAGGILIPVADYKTFVAKNPNCTEGEGGIAILSAPNSPLGGFAMKEAGKGKYAIVVPESEKATLTILTEAIKKSPKPLVKKIAAAQAKDAATAPAWAYVNLAGLYEKYNQDALGMLEMAQAGVSQTGGPAEMMAFQFKMMAEMFKEFADEADSATIALTPQPSILTLDIALQAKDGSELAKMMVSDTKTTGYKLTNYLDNNNAVNGLMKMNASFMQKFYDKVFDIMEATTDNPTSKEQTAKMKVLTQKMFTAMGDEVSFSYSYAGGMPPFKLQEVVEIKDSSAMKAMVTEGIDYANAMYKNMKIPAELKYEQGVSTYKNATIDRVSISIVASDDPSDPMQKEIEKMYGDGFKYYLAQSPDKFYITMGQGGEETLKKLIDQPAKSAAPSGDIKIAMDALQNSPYNGLVCSVNVIKLMKGMGEMMQTMGAQTSMGPAAAMFTGLKDVQTQSCLVMGGKVADGQAAMRLGVPKQHLAEIVAIAMQLQMQAAAAQQQMQNAPMPEMSAAPPQSSMQAETAAQNPLTSWIGKPAPDFKMVDLEGNIHRVSRLKGKKIMLDFWATWCPPCKKSIPDLIKLRADSNDSELVIIGLSNEPAETLNSFAENAKINYPIVAYDNVPAPYNQVTGIPTLFLIDSKGVIQDVLVGYHPPEEIQSRLEKIN